MWSKRTGISYFATALFTMVICSLGVFSQDADTRFPGQKPLDPDQPITVREMQKKMQIDLEKKEYDELVQRGEQAVKISSDLEKAFAEQPNLSRADLEKLDELEKLVKKIRNSLGGGNGDDSDNGDQDDPPPKTAGDAFKDLQTLTEKMVGEIKKTSRFGVSVIAIESSNAVLKVVRFLKFSK
jgi:hypothetical protein